MTENASISRRDWILAIALAVGLTVVFWWPLWTGGGIIGGDLFTYFFPQKQFYAERLAEGEIPLWHNRTGFGYPLLAESQTGVFYPPHLLLYRCFDVNTAYNLNQLLHYALTFLLTWRYAREVGLRNPGALFASLIFTYGWFPSRLCLEWAIVGGPYLPGLLLLVERFLRTGWWRFPLLMSVTVGVQLLAGHFNLAFVTYLVVAAYVPCRLWHSTDHVTAGLLAHRIRTLTVVAGCLAGGFALAAIQLLPTWELKQASQRSASTEISESVSKRDFDPAYGHIPPLYLSQVVASWWFWYTPDVDRDQAIQTGLPLTYQAGTNQVEAHLYFGLIPVGLIVCGFVSVRLRGTTLSRFNLIWLLFSLAAVIYATAWLLPLTRHLPGFAFFRGPGRYGIVATFGVALVAGAIFSKVTERSSAANRASLLFAVMLLTAAEFWWISRIVTNATILPSSPLANLEESQLSRRLRAESPPARVHSVGPNLTNLLGTSSVPEYLGLGPAEYYAPELKVPEAAVADQSFAAWARRGGVTHVLTQEPLADDRTARDAGLEPVPPGADRFLNQSWARGPQELLFLYEVQGTRGRLSFEKPVDGQQIELSRYAANEVVAEVETAESGRLILTDLMYPGWQVTIDGEPVDAVRFEKMFRAVDVPPGRHIIHWEFSPASLQTGCWVSGLTLLAILAIGHVRFWHFRPKPEPVD